MLNTLKLEDINPLTISLTGVRLLVIFALLLEKPRTAEEINEYFKKNNYPKDMFSIDTLRNDLNALRYSGCDISRADKSNGNSYTLSTHPFGLQISQEQAKCISKAYNKIYKHLNIKDLIDLEALLNKIANYTINEEICEYLKGISLIKKADKSILLDLIKAQSLNKKISFTYKSPNSGKQTFEFRINDFEFRSKKLYINGYDYTHNTESFLLVNNICSSINFSLLDDNIEIKPKKIIFELKNNAKNNYKHGENEIISEKSETKIKIEYTYTNKFKMIQKIMHYGLDCTVIEPQEIRDEIITLLNNMYEVYK